MNSPIWHAIPGGNNAGDAGRLAAVKNEPESGRRFQAGCGVRFMLPLVFLCAASSCAETPSVGPGGRVTDNLTGPQFDWRAQDYGDSLGVTDVVHEASGLVLRCDLRGGTTNKSSGEIVLDLRYVAGLEPVIPLNMTGMTGEVVLDISENFVTDSHAPSGVQILFKDASWRSQYSSWENVTGSGRLTVRHAVSSSEPPGGYMDAGFDPTRIRSIGVKLGMNSQSTRRFSGNIQVISFSVKPGLPVSPIQLPAPKGAALPKAGLPVSVEKGFFAVNGKKWFVVGGNHRLIEYGQNFGATKWFPNGNGVSKHRGYLDENFALLRRAGVTVLRVGLLDDGCAVLDKDGAVTGYNTIFKKDVQTFLDLCLKNDLKAEIVLVDYLIAGRSKVVDGVWVRGRRSVLETESIRNQFRTHFLQPFLKEFGAHPAVFSVDIINEPEWILSQADGGGWETVKDQETKTERPVSLADFRAFVSACIEDIRKLAPGKPVTVGTSCPNIGLTKDLGLDYFAPHYYPWMGELKATLGTATKAFAGTPWILEEFPGSTTISNYFTTVHDLGGAGALVWSLSPEIDKDSTRFSNFSDVLRTIQEFAAELRKKPK